MSHSHKVMVKNTLQFLQQKYLWNFTSNHQLLGPKQMQILFAWTSVAGCNIFLRKGWCNGMQLDFLLHPGNFLGKINILNPPKSWRFGSDSIFRLNWVICSLVQWWHLDPWTIRTPGRHQHVMPGFSQDFLDDKLRTQRLYRSVCHRDAFDQLGFNMHLLQSTIINQTISEFHSNIDLSAPLRTTVKVKQLWYVSEQTLHGYALPICTYHPLLTSRYSWYHWNAQLSQSWTSARLPTNWYCWCFRNPKANHRLDVRKPVNNGIFTIGPYQLVSRISEPSTVWPTQCQDTALKLATISFWVSRTCFKETTGSIYLCLQLRLGVMGLIFWDFHGSSSRRVQVNRQVADIRLKFTPFQGWTFFQSSLLNFI